MPGIMSNDTLFEKPGIGIIRKFVIRFFMMIFIVGLFAGALSNFRYSQPCSRSNTDVTISSHWRIDTPAQIASILWERSLSSRDSLLSSSSDSVVFFRGASVNACVQGDRLIALDISTADHKWDFPAQLVRAVTPLSDGYVFSECCTVLTKINSQGEKVWQSDKINERTYEPKVQVGDNKVYFFADSLAYEFSNDNGKLIRKLPAGMVKTVSGAITVEVVANEVFVLSSDNSDLLWNVQLPSVDNDSEIVGEIIGNALILSQQRRITAYNISSGQVLWKIDENMLASPIFNESFAFTYSAENKVHIYDLESGNLMEEISLQYDNAGSSDTNGSVHRSYLALNRDVLFIYDKSSLTLVAMKINLKDIYNTSTS